MDKYLATFEVLIGLAAVDGRIHPKEVDVIKTFLRDNFGNITFDADQVVDALSQMSGDGLLAEVGQAAAAIYNECSAPERSQILDFSLELISADGRITHEERILFMLMAEKWGFDIEAYLKEKGIKIGTS